MDSGMRGKQEEEARLDVDVLVPTTLCSGAEYVTAVESCFTVETSLPGWSWYHVLPGMEHCSFTSVISRLPVFPQSRNQMRAKRNFMADVVSSAVPDLGETFMSIHVGQAANKVMLYFRSGDRWCLSENDMIFFRRLLLLTEKLDCYVLNYRKACIYASLYLLPLATRKGTSCSAVKQLACNNCDLTVTAALVRLCLSRAGRWC